MPAAASGLYDDPHEDGPGPDDPQQALLAQTLAHALQPPLSPAPPPRSPSADPVDPEALALPFTVQQQPTWSLRSALTTDLPPPLCSRRAGFSLHGARTVETRDRAGLERLCRYGLRPPFAAERLSILPDGRIRYALRKPWPTRDGRTKDELILDPIDFLRRLAALVPPPYFNTVRYHGVFASRSKLHPRLPLPPPPPPATQGIPLADLGAPVHHDTAGSAPDTGARHVGSPAKTATPQTLLPLPCAATDTKGAASGATELGHADSHADSHHKGSSTTASAEPEPKPMTRKGRTATSKHSRGRTGWAALLMRALHIDALKCPAPGCAGRMVVLAFLTDPRIVAKVLDHLGLPSCPPTLAPPRLPSDPEFAFDPEPSDEVFSGDDPDHPAPRSPTDDALAQAARPPPPHTDGQDRQRDRPPGDHDWHDESYVH